MASLATGSVNFPVVEQSVVPGTHRILNVHKNVPGVLRDINRIVSDHNANIRAQVLSTDPDIGYLIMDVEQDVSQDVKRDTDILNITRTWTFTKGDELQSN